MIERGESLIRISCIRKQSIFNKRKNILIKFIPKPESIYEINL